MAIGVQAPVLKYDQGAVVQTKRGSTTLLRYDSAHYKAAPKKNSVRVLSAKESIADGP